INTNHLTIEKLKKQLKEYGVDTDISNNRVVLVEILQNKLNDEILQQNMAIITNCFSYFLQQMYLFIKTSSISSTTYTCDGSANRIQK
ncbi:18995_t:CDS:2, partial [Rhizophagus irregularis]